MMSAALSDCEISSAGSPILNTHVKPSESCPCEQKRGKIKKMHPANRSARECSDKYRKSTVEKMTC